jgi:release factor glutamine methyltransferase
MESSRSAATIAGAATPPAAAVTGTTLEGLLAWARSLGVAGLDAQLLLARALGRPRSHLLAFGEQACPEPARAEFAGWVLRRARGEPLAYIAGEREFWSHTLRVTPDVLVPRPETELLVERALALGPMGAAEVLDLGTGSGAIAVALASERPTWQVTATDASSTALAVADANARALGLGNCRFTVGHWFAPLAGRRFALIVSNPPYIAPGDAALLDPALRHEPAVALVSPPDGLTALREIISGAPDHLTPGGVLALEHGHDQHEAVAALLRAAGFNDIALHRDLAGLPRVTEGRLD